jgi:hypothetical protein
MTKIVLIFILFSSTIYALKIESVEDKSGKFVIDKNGRKILNPIIINKVLEPIKTNKILKPIKTNKILLPLKRMG